MVTYREGVRDRTCSFWADGFGRMIPHLAARHTTLVAISRAPLQKLAAFTLKRVCRIGWTGCGCATSISRRRLRPPAARAEPRRGRHCVNHVGSGGGGFRRIRLAFTL